MAFCTHCITICKTQWDDQGFISCSACGKVLGQVTVVKKIKSRTRYKKVKRNKKINSQFMEAVVEAAPSSKCT